jgi:hypothetical protein
MWMHAENPTVCDIALAALCNVSVNVDTNQVSEITSDDLDAIVNAMRAHQNVEGIQRKSLILLKNFSFSRSNIMVMEQNPCLVPLIRSARSTWQIDFEGRVHYLLHVLFAVNQ